MGDLIEKAMGEDRSLNYNTVCDIGVVLND